ncbi:MAG: chorismate mutase [Acidovorax sp.]|jgi:isochorismate pyruvate lyase|uniref:chorismate mutase n=1 Tax=Acidovorax sp. TaxID=1872122 RepID=UPI002629F58F|nr:chorismate mutase [Acidovorax sp.]MCO4094439.1 chorismate mutase [Acidovorax sp.]MDH4427107.1 chorismate mutase [Acidovorax sp.]
MTDLHTPAIDLVQPCTTMSDVRRHIDALDDILVPLLVQRTGYMTQAARIKPSASLVRDEARIEAIVQRVRAAAAAHGGQPDVVEAMYRSLMEHSIAYEHREFARLRAGQADAARNSPAARDAAGSAA